MKSGFALREIEELNRSILYLKMSELRHLAQSLGLSDQGQKRDLIAGIMSYVHGADSPARPRPARIRRGAQFYTLDAPLHPETFTNGSAARHFLQQEIGAHFHFTTFGMDWIKQQWADGLVPTFREFIQYWEREYKERKSGKPFLSKPELARVNFYRRMAELGTYNKGELEALWKQTRLRHVEIVKSILSAGQ